MYGRLPDVQRGRVLIIFPDVFLTDLLGGDPFFFGAVDDLIVHIGEVLDVFDLVSPVFQILSQRIEYDERPGVSDVEIIVHGRTADIHPDLAFFDGLQFFFLSGQCIIYSHLT